MFAALAFLVLLPRHAHAFEDDDDLVPDKVLSTAKKDGWYPRIGLGATFSFAHTSNVSSTQDGQTWNIGPKLSLGIDLRRDGHEWRNRLGFNYVLTRTPVIDRFVKTTDELVLESLYLYHVPSAPWFGPYVLLKMETAVSASEHVGAKTAAYQTTELDGWKCDPAANACPTGTSFGLTDAFAPLHLRQAVGASAVPVDRKPVRFELRLGAGARETFVKNGLGLDDNDDTEEVVELKRLQDFQQIGGELYVGLSGTITFKNLGKDRPLTYSASAEYMLPFYSSEEPPDKGVLDLANVVYEAALGIRLFSWMSLDYTLKAVRQPLLSEEFQIQNNLLLNFQVAIVE